MAGRDPTPQDIDAKLRGETARLLKEMDELLRRAKDLLDRQQTIVGELKEDKAERGKNDATTKNGVRSD